MTDRHTEFAREIVLAIAPEVVQNRSKATYGQLSADYGRIFANGPTEEAKKDWESWRDAYIKILEKDISVECVRVALAIAEEFKMQSGNELERALATSRKEDEERRIKLDLTKETL